MQVDYEWRELHFMSMLWWCCCYSGWWKWCPIRLLPHQHFPMPVCCWMTNRMFWNIKKAKRRRRAKISYLTGDAYCKRTHSTWWYRVRAWCVHTTIEATANSNLSANSVHTHDVFWQPSAEQNNVYTSNIIFYHLLQPYLARIWNEDQIKGYKVLWPCWGSWCVRDTHWHPTNLFDCIVIHR